MTLPVNMVLAIHLLEHDSANRRTWAGMVSAMHSLEHDCQRRRTRVDVLEVTALAIMRLSSDAWCWQYTWVSMSMAIHLSEHESDYRNVVLAIRLS